MVFPRRRLSRHRLVAEGRNGPFAHPESWIVAPFQENDYHQLGVLRRLSVSFFSDFTNSSFRTGENPPVEIAVGAVS